MARGFGMTALRAALGGVAGYGQDVAARREREKLDAEMARQQERQAAMDRIALRREGYMTPEEAGAERGAGGAALSRALASASGMLAGRPGPAFGQALGASDGSAIVRGMSQVGPQQRETIGGQAFVRESPVAAALRAQEMAANRERMGEERKQAQERTEKQGEFERNVQSAMSAYGMKRPQAEEYVRTGKSPFLPMSQQERDASARGWADINLRRKEQPGGGYAMPGQDFTQDLAIIKDYLPTVDEKTGALVPPKQKLTGGKMLAVQRGGPGGTLPGQMTALGYTMAGGDLSDEQKYNTSAEGIATAYAIQEQRGRNVSDRDVMNRISQVVVQPNEVGNIEVQKLKGDRLQRWANAVMSGQVQQIQPGQTGAQPTFSDRVSGADGGDAELTRARNAIAGGAPRDKVIQVYEQRTGNKWPGG
jgi:hypothetical protein